MDTVGFWVGIVAAAATFIGGIVFFFVALKTFQTTTNFGKAIAAQEAKADNSESKSSQTEEELIQQIKNLTATIESMKGESSDVGGNKS